MIYIGIDNGLQGAIATIYESGEADVFAMPTIRGKEIDYDAVADYIRSLDVKNVYAAIEDVTASMRADGTFDPKTKKPNYRYTPAKTLVRLCGRKDKVEGMLILQRIKREVVSVKKWQAFFGLKLINKDVKAASIILAKRLFPGVSLLPTDKCKRDSDGMSDALLLAEYERRINGDGHSSKGLQC